MTLKALTVVLALLNAAPQEQERILEELYDHDPAAAREVLTVAEDISRDHPALLHVVNADRIVLVTLDELCGDKGDALMDAILANGVVWVAAKDVFDDDGSDDGGNAMIVIAIIAI